MYCIVLLDAQTSTPALSSSQDRGGCMQYVVVVCYILNCCVSDFVCLEIPIFYSVCEVAGALHCLHLDSIQSSGGYE